MKKLFAIAMAVAMMLTLFASKENTMLLAFPCNYSEIFLSKIIVFSLEEMKKNGQVATQYADLSGNATMVSPFNPNGSMWAIEGITSPDGRVLGKMGHSERIGDNLYKNVEGNFDMKIFESGVRYFK